MKKTRNRERVIIKGFDIVPIIDPLTYYTTGQILKLGLIPGFKYSVYCQYRLYGILLYQDIDGIRYPHEETTKDKIKTINGSTIGSSQARRKVQGIELIKFLQLNNALPK